MSRSLLQEFQSKGGSIEERIAAGKQLRKAIPRAELGDFRPAADRPDPVAILEEQGKSRLQYLLPVRYQRMLTSPFAFFRGAAAIMAADIASDKKTTGIIVQACGDMHIGNFGLFASAERNLIFGINDFDETLPAPWDWDLKRLAASIVISGQFLGADKNICTAAVRAAVSCYRNKMKEYAEMGNLDLWYATIKEKDILKTLTDGQKKSLKNISAKARKSTHLQVLGKLTDIVDDQHRLKDHPPFVVHETQTQAGRPIKEALGLFLESYLSSLAEDRRKLLSHYKILDVVRKTVGVGSVGTRCWLVFLVGENTGDPLFLQIKEAQRSVLEPYLAQSTYINAGERVVQGQRLIQGAPDIFLGWGEQDGMQFYVRQLRDMKGGVEIDGETVKLENMGAYCGLCAWALALAHAKSGDAAMIAGYAGNGDELDEAMVNFAFAYATQNEKDFNALQAAAKSGRVRGV